MSREDVLEDKDMQNLVEEFAKVEAEENVPAEATLEKKEEAASPSSNEAGEAPKDEPPRELPETDETTTEAEVVAEGNDTEPVDELSQQLTDLAEIYGLHPELLAGQFTSVDDARAALELLDKSYASEAQAYAQQDYEYEGAPEEYQQEDAEPRAQQKPPVEEKPWADLALEDWDDDDALAKNFKGIDHNTQKLAQRVMQLEDMLQGLGQKTAQDSFNETMERLNSVIDKEESQLFGGPEDLTPTQEKNRIKLLQQADILVAGMNARGAPLPSEDQLIERAMQLAFKTEIGRERALGKAKARNSRRLGVPSRGNERSVTDLALQHSGPLEENQAFIDLYKRMEEEN